MFNLFKKKIKQIEIIKLEKGDIVYFVLPENASEEQIKEFTDRIDNIFKDKNRPDFIAGNVKIIKRIVKKRIK